MSNFYSTDAAMTSSYCVKCTDVPQFDALQDAAAEFLLDEKLHLRYLCNDTARCSGLTASLTSYTQQPQLPLGNAAGSSLAAPPPTPLIRKIILDYSRQQVTGETMELLFDLADAVNLTDRREAFRTGERINTTENKPVLHHLLRVPPPDAPMRPQPVHRQASINNVNRPVITTNNDTSEISNRANAAVLEQIHATRRQIEKFSMQVRSGQYKSSTGDSFKDTIVVTAGMEQLATRFVHRALTAHQAAFQASQGRRLHFLSNKDPVDSFFTTHELNPATTLVVMVLEESTIGSNELLNWKTIRHWLVTNLCKENSTLSEASILELHMVAVTSKDPQACLQLGISKNNVFPIWDWVIGRFSVCSAVGVLPLSLQYGYEVVSEFLDGAHDMDEHFFNAPLRDNIPVLLGLLGVWNSTFLGYTARAILPFSEALDAFPAYVQLVDMESNGKRVAMDGLELFHPAGELNFGEVAGNPHHPFYQLMHQGRVVPADFIGFMESPRPIELPGEAVSSHDEFMSNFFAQPDALAYGKSLVDLVQEGVPDGLREHMVFPGNRPSSSLLITRLDPFSIGQLLAMYEHRTAVQGFIWGINSFDQFGLEMGKLLAKYIRVQLAASRRTGATVQGFNQSTSSLLEAYLSHGKKGK
ncbi:glucose-6-phosphate isomerase [Nitzschia inconspicua]|uniref:Glucose-6-phosphate isomerase n=1 Tax=Nitzschia inconspicua TaxID=303405 RepID=A0A9K3PKM4_9STRA|nr:glucose-6-phosphate isomerase [Nitzschia inconspicua]